MNDLILNLAPPSAVRASFELLPVMEPMFNVREAAKNMLLLEDHLTCPRKRCRDCIIKHFALIEAYAEEGCSLNDGAAFAPLLSRVAEFSRVLLSALLKEEVCFEEAARLLRAARKPLLIRSTRWMVENKYEPQGAVRDGWGRQCGEEA